MTGAVTRMSPPYSPRRPANALAALRQLASQGVPMEAAFPALQAILNQLVHIDGIVAGRVDGAANPVASLACSTMQAVDWGNYFVNFFNQREAEAYPTFRRFLMSGAPMDRYHARGEGLYRTDVFHEVLAPAGMLSGVRIAIGDPARRVGKLSLFRPDKMGFSPREERLLESARRYLGHLWDAPSEMPDFSGEECVAEAWLLADRQGQIHFRSERAGALLHRAADVPEIHPYLADACYSWARPLLTQLAQRLDAAEQGRADGAPLVARRNRFGIFKLRAWRMASITGGSDCMGVRIDHYLPLSLRLLSSPAAQALSPRERDVLLALAAGLSKEETASRLGVGLASVVTYVRGLYARLGVSNRDQLVAAVLASGDRTIPKLPLD